MKLKDFQENAVQDLVKQIKQSLMASVVNPNLPLQNVVFKSPTGSGKTIMTAEALKRLPEDFSLSEMDIAFLWLAPMKLHAQSYDKLSKALADTEYDLINIDSGVPSGALNDKTILFSNWEKLTTTAGRDNPDKNIQKGDWTNIATRQGETEKNLIDVMEATRASGTKIILIVDESHQAFYGAKSQRFVSEVVKPDLVVEVSATPKQKPTIEVLHDDVVESGLIKKSIIINNDLGKESGENAKGIIEELLRLALKKREDLVELYQQNGKDINPLILVQLPNESSETMDELDMRDREIIEEALADYGISYGDGNLAVWLSEDKQNLDNIEDRDNPVKVLIFKQAIALGWDCPRAQIMVMLRDVKSDTFKIQTVGRILRMPEANHYDNDDLDTAYIYSDLESIKIDRNEKDPLVNLIKYKKSTIQKLFKDSNVKLPSVFLHRTDYGDLRASFRPELKKQFYRYFKLNDGIDEKTAYKNIDDALEIYEDELNVPILADEVIENMDDAVDKMATNTADLIMNDSTIDRIFNLLLREFILPYKSFARSRSIVYPELRELFSTAGIDEETMKKIFVCSSKNQDVLRDIFKDAIDSYDSINQKEMKQRRDREMEEFDWSVPEEDEFSDNYSEAFVNRNIYDKYYRKNDVSTTEKKFEDLLDHSDSILWWYKNGEKMEKYFAVPYSFMGDNAKTYRNAFYPDYVVRFKDGTIGIFETKGGAAANPEYHSNKSNKPKADALQYFLRDHKELGIWGGIVDVGRNDSFHLQGDAITQEMARQSLESDNVSLPEVNYDPTKWSDLRFTR